VAVDNFDDRQSIYFGDLEGANVLSLQWASPNRLVYTTEDWVIGVAELGNSLVETKLEPHRFQARISFRVEDPSAEDPFASFEMAMPPRLLNLSPTEPNIAYVEGVVGENVRNAFL